MTEDAFKLFWEKAQKNGMRKRNLEFAMMQKKAPRCNPHESAEGKVAEEEANKWTRYNKSPIGKNML